MKRILSHSEQVELYRTLPNVDTSAVHAFVSDLPLYTSLEEDNASLTVTSRLNEWGENTERAIRRGIELSHNCN